jgi:hypothetical protein
LIPLCFLTFLLSLKVVLRRSAAVALWVLLTLVLSALNPGLGLWEGWHWAVNAVAAALFVLVWTRCGLLVCAVQWLTVSLSRGILLTENLSAWYATRGVFAVVVPFALAVYGFLLATGGRRWIPDEILDS